MGLGAVLAVVAGVAGLAAYEAHVINVTAKIENALSVTPTSIHFGTVFPQEYVTSTFTVQLSPSFLEEYTADDVNYVIKQKAKPKNPDNPVPEPFETWHDYCAATVLDLTNCYPLLCPFISKTPDGTPPNDGSLAAFHDPNATTSGRLAKTEGDTSDTWTIDLDVPCFDGQCAQDWGHPGYELPAQLNGEEFGCDLWIEVTGISRRPPLQ